MTLSRPDRERRRTRAQTTIDFAIGAGIFLFVVAFVFAFTPGALTPFVDSQQPQSADRVASKLAGGELGSAGQPYQLDRECTSAFFEHFGNGSGVGSDCRFDDETDSINGALGVRSTASVNVTIRRDGSVRTLDDGVRLAAGDARPERTPMTTARRTVRFDGTTHQLVVAVW